MQAYKYQQRHAKRRLSTSSYIINTGLLNSLLRDSGKIQEALISAQVCTIQLLKKHNLRTSEIYQQRHERNYQTRITSMQCNCNHRQQESQENRPHKDTQQPLLALCSTKKSALTFSWQPQLALRSVKTRHTYTIGGAKTERKTHQYTTVQHYKVDFF